MADKAVAPGKLVLKPGVIASFMSNMGHSEDREGMLFTEIDCSGQDLE